MFDCRISTKILIQGHGKSGTTVFLFKVSGGLPNCQAFSGGDPGKNWGGYENAVYKHTYSEAKGRDFEPFMNHVTQANYDRKIWMAHDHGKSVRKGAISLPTHA